MKKILLTVFSLIFFTILGFSQIVDPRSVLENDPAVRKGKLDNGMTYYLLHNEKPAQRAEFYLVTNVGAIQETPAQNGLAHFLEHMCFNGTKNFPDKALLDYFQKIGAEFGRNINASTGVEKTMYMLNNIPLTREGILDSALLVMHDYSAFVLNDPAEIDKERGVIIEEWRTRRNSGWRMFEKAMPFLYNGSKYSNCNIIGTVENLKNFKPEALTSFYKTWYRPDLQALIVVGDIDIDAVEAKIKTLFADIPAKENPQAKEFHQIPNNEDPLVGIITDPEASSISINVYFKQDPIPTEMKNTGAAFLNNLMQSLVSLMLNERLADIETRPNAPFLSAQVGFSPLTVTKDAFYAGVGTKENASVEGLKALLIELEKVKRYGFTEAEYNRAKTNILSFYESRKNSASSRNNADFIDAIADNFTDNAPYMTPEYRYNVANGYLSVIQVDQINQTMAASDFYSNSVVIYNGPEKENIVNPTPEEITAMMKSIASLEIAAPVQEESNLVLVDPTTLKGSPVKKEKKGEFETTVWELKNGIKVILKPTDYKKDQVFFKMSNQGGESLIATEDLPSVESNVVAVWQEGAGLGELNSTDLKKALTGKRASASPYFTTFEQGINGNSTKKDLETMFQLVYLNYTAPRFNEEDFNTGMEKLKSILPNYVQRPDYKFQKHIGEVLYGKNPRMEEISVESLQKANLATLEKCYKQLFSNAKGSVATIVGDFDLETIKPLVEKYLGSLPTAKKAPKWIDPKEDMVKGKIEAPIELAMETPKTTVVMVISGDTEYSNENNVISSATNYILDLIYTKTIREEEGGTYGVSSQGSISPLPKDEYTLQIAFDTDPEKVEKLITLAEEGLKSLATDGPTQEQVNMVKENYLKNISEKRINNMYWAGSIIIFEKYGIDRDSNYEEVVNGLTPEKIKNFVKNILDQGNEAKFIMTPAK